MPSKIASNDGTGVTGWGFKRADEIKVGDFVFLIVNVPVEILEVHPETTQNSAVSVIRVKVKGQYGTSTYLARLAHEIVVYEIREETT